MSNPPHATEAGKTFLGHPRGLFMLFFAEMWERFSYYGMRALLVLYLTKHWLFSDGDASMVYGAYTALVYITPVIGGYLADKYLGQRKAVLYGAVLLVIGHFLMGFEGSGDQGSPAMNAFWLALAFIIVGSGFLKANISVMVGQLYPRTDVRRDGAYTIFYMGINLGAFLGSLLCGYLGETYGWKYGFGAAGVGMLLGLIVFVVGKPLLEGNGESSNPVKLRERVAGIPFEWTLYLLGIAIVAACWWMVQNQQIVGWALGIFGAILLLYVVALAVFKLPYGSFEAAPRMAFSLFLLGGAAVVASLAVILITAGALPVLIWLAIGGLILAIGIVVHQFVIKRDEVRDRIFAAMILMIGSVLFWALFEQAGSSLNLYTDRYVDRNMLGWEVPASMFQSINAMYIILLAPFFAMLWTWLGKRGLEPSAPAKFGLAMIQLGFGFLVLVAGAAGVATGNMTPVLFIFLIYLLHTTGELCLSPVGLSAMNRLAPAHLASLIMGCWFFASATGNFVAGLIAAATGSEAASGEDAAQQVVLDVYSTVGWVAVAVGVGFILVSPLIRKLMHLDTLKDDEVPGQAELAEPAAGGIDPTGQRRV
ncbi:peptide MFS transporter [Luteimonas aestuarii]|uniref:peptide MFS transporter n=1 Tax=Luteimonas aestuarii TaxID=453837 RepID=UPI001A9D88C6|nr:peptide MFS transporter [Luteimonas aestuarii]